MPKGISEKTITAWFEKLNFDAQASVLTALNAAHTSVKSSKIAELQKQIEALGGHSNGNGRKKSNGNGNGHKASAPVKYRDPATGDTWSGRGRMARWLSVKVKAGQKAEKFLVS